MIARKTLCLLVCMWAGHVLFSQQPTLSPQAEISVVTCGAGSDLYATFGHSAFRVRDPASGIDWVYNYGTFDFNTPNFYLKFARGKLRYALSREPFANFLYTYQLENRWVREQLLALDNAQKNAVFRFLEENNRPENRYYAYDFLFENCATKIPEVLRAVLGPDLEFRPDHLTGSNSFRDLIQRNLHRNSWSSFGIDLALGGVIDRDAEPEEYMFLPEFVRLQMDNSLLSGQPLVKRERLILDLNHPQVQPYFTAAPLFWMLLLLAFTATITWIDLRNGSRSRWLDFFLLLLTGLCGVVITFLWFLTDHSATVWNANILWAFPLSVLAAWKWMLPRVPDTPWRRYILLLLLLLAICPLVWLTGLQAFSPILIPVWIALAIRYAYLNRLLKNGA